MLHILRNTFCMIFKISFSRYLLRGFYKPTLQFQQFDDGELQ